jgi:DNA-binding response OmpR family regulator
MSKKTASERLERSEPDRPDPDRRGVRQHGIARGAKAREEAALDARQEPQGPHVLLAEDDTEMRRFLVESLQDVGFRVTAVADGEQLRRKLTGTFLDAGASVPDVVVSDIRLPAKSGLSMLQELRTRDWSLPVVLITAFGDDAIHLEGERLGAAVTLDKPFDVEDLVSTLKDLVPM